MQSISYNNFQYNLIAFNALFSNIYSFNSLTGIITYNKLYIEVYKSNSFACEIDKTITVTNILFIPQNLAWPLVNPSPSPSLTLLLCSQETTDLLSDIVGYMAFPVILYK